MSSEESVILGILAVFAGFFIAIIVVAIVLYILYALGMFRIAKTLGREDMAFLAWIPIAQTFLLTLVVEDDVHESLRGKFTLIYAVSWVGSIVLGMFFTPFVYLSIIVLLYGFYVLANRFSENAIVHTIIGVVTLGVSVPISLFRFRKREPIA